MHSVEIITAVEDRYCATQGNPSLGEAFEMWALRWSSGLRDRETALRLMFLAWYSCSEPNDLTGLPCDERLKQTFADAFESLGGANSTDAEVCYVVGLMARLFPWCIGEEGNWSRTGLALTQRAQLLALEGIQPRVFQNRGVYGEYFAHMLACGARDA